MTGSASTAPLETPIHPASSSSSSPSPALAIFEESSTLLMLLSSALANSRASHTPFDIPKDLRRLFSRSHMADVLEKVKKEMMVMTMATRTEGNKDGKQGADSSSTADGVLKEEMSSSEDGPSFFTSLLLLQREAQEPRER
jgi:hypothetical protein